MATILVVGDDVALLETREMVLRTIGAETVCSRTASALTILASRNFNLVVLCHSVAAPDCSDLVKAVRARWPQTRVLAISRHRGDGIGVAADAISSATPEELIRHTKEQLRLILDGAA